MSREIKFRAWAKDAKFMFDIDDKDYFINNDGIYERESREYSGDEYNNVSERYILMQFTGLCDKDGEEIYEGDIVKKLLTQTPKDYYENYVIKYECASMKMFPVIAGKPTFLEWPAACCLEIIGNIHQHKDLIEKGIGR